MDQPPTNAIPPKDSSESSSDTWGDERRALLFGVFVFFFVLVAWRLGIQAVVLAALLGAINSLVVLGCNRFVGVYGSLADYRKAIDVHSEQLNILLDERDRWRGIARKDTGRPDV